MWPRARASPVAARVLKPKPAISGQKTRARLPRPRTAPRKVLGATELPKKRAPLPTFIRVMVENKIASSPLGMSKLAR